MNRSGLPSLCDNRFLENISQTNDGRRVIPNAMGMFSGSGNHLEVVILVQNDAVTSSHVPMVNVSLWLCKHLI